jgi:hypothetical protein
VTQDEAVVLEKFTSRLEAEMAAGLLEAEGIQAFVSADDAGGTYPPLQYLGGVRLIVFMEDEPRAREILADWREAQTQDLDFDEDMEDEIEEVPQE